MRSVEYEYTDSGDESKVSEQRKNEIIMKLKEKIIKNHIRYSYVFEIAKGDQL